MRFMSQGQPRQKVQEIPLQSKGGHGTKHLTSPYMRNTNRIMVHTSLSIKQDHISKINAERAGGIVQVAERLLSNFEHVLFFIILYL
jgi:hypothetical protein